MKKHYSITYTQLDVHLKKLIASYWVELQSRAVLFASSKKHAGRNNKLYGKSFLLSGFFSPTPEMKARDQAVQKRHRNQESVEWLQIYCMIHSDISDEN